MPKVKKDRDRTPFGRRMWEARKAAGLTQEQVCKAVGVSQSTLSEAELTGTGTSKLVDYADLYRVPARWLASGEGPGIVSVDETSSTPASWPDRLDRAVRLATAFGDVPELMPNGLTKDALYAQLMGAIREHMRQGRQTKAPAPDSHPSPTAAPRVDLRKRRAAARAG